MPVLSNSRHERFAQELAKGKTADEAYREAGYRENRGNAARLKANEGVLARVRELQEAAAEKAVLSKAWIIERLMTNAERALQQEPVLDHDGNETGEFTYQGMVANKALELLGKEIGMFKQAVELTGKDGGPIQTEETNARDLLYGRIGSLSTRVGEEGGAGKPH